MRSFSLIVEKTGAGKLQFHFPLGGGRNGCFASITGGLLQSEESAVKRAICASNSFLSRSSHKRNGLLSHKCNSTAEMKMGRSTKITNTTPLVLSVKPSNAWA